MPTNRRIGISYPVATGDSRRFTPFGFRMYRILTWQRWLVGIRDTVALVRETLLAEPFHISLPAFSRHLRVLERARLIERKRDGRLHLIRARTGPMKEAQSWITKYVA